MLIERHSEIPQQANDQSTEAEVMFMSNIELSQLQKPAFQNFYSFTNKSGKVVDFANHLRRNAPSNSKVKISSHSVKSADFDKFSELEFKEDEINGKLWIFEKPDEIHFDAVSGLIGKISSPEEEGEIFGMERLRFSTNHRKVNFNFF